MNRRSVLKTIGGVSLAGVLGYGVSGGHSENPPVNDMGYLDLDRVPKHARKDGRILTKVNDSWYWINLDELAFEPVEGKQ